GQVGCPWVQPLAQRRLTSPVIAVTYTAIQSVMRTSSGDAGLHVRRSWRNSMVAGAPNKEILGKIGQSCFKAAGFREGGQIETQPRNDNEQPDQYNDRPCDSSSHSVPARSLVTLPYAGILGSGILILTSGPDNPRCRSSRWIWQGHDSRGN